MRPVTVYQIRVARPDKIGEGIRSAFRAAWSLGGPVQVDIPRDFFYGEVEEPEQESAQYRTDGCRGGAPARQIQAAVELLLHAKKPVILAGLGVVRTNSADKIAVLAERLGAPVCNVFMHNDAFPMSHPLGLGPIGYQGSKAAMRVIAETDTILAMGTRLNRFGLNPQYGLDLWPANAALILNSHNPLELGAQVPITAGLLGDCAEVATQLIDALGERPASRKLTTVTELVAKEKEK